MPPDEEGSSSLLDRLHSAGKKARISQDGRILSPEEVVPPDAYRPESKGRGLHAIVERANPWRSGKPVPLEGALEGATVLLLWFRLDDRPIEGTALWDRSAEIVAPALAFALHGLAAHEHLVIRGDIPRPQGVDPPLEALTDFIRRYFDSWSFRAYCGPNPKARRSTTDGDDEVAFAKQRARDLSKWLVVADEVYDSGALEIWSLKLDSHQLSGRLPLPEINDLLALVDLKAYLPG